MKLCPCCGGPSANALAFGVRMCHQCADGALVTVDEAERALRHQAPRCGGSFAATAAEECELESLWLEFEEHGVLFLDD